MFDPATSQIRVRDTQLRLVGCFEVHIMAAMFDPAIDRLRDRVTGNLAT